MLISKFGQGEGAVAWLEARIGCQLPADYASFLRTYNGGITYKTDVKVGRSWEPIRTFYGVGRVHAYYTFDELAGLGILDGFVTRQLLPIASTPFGDYTALSLQADDFGFIYLCEHEAAGKKKTVADSFTTLLTLSRSKKIGKIRTIEERAQGLIALGLEANIDGLVPVWQEEIERLSKLVQEEIVLPSTKE